MKQLAQYIAKEIQGNLEEVRDKYIIRVEGFEDLRLYCLLCETISAYCQRKGIRLVAKLAGRKFELLQGGCPFEAAKMKQYDWVDTQDHMTSYRNLVPQEGEKLAILLLGTDLVDDRGGLEDFFAITPQKIDGLIGKKYSALMSDGLKQSIDLTGEENLDHVVDSFYGSLFRQVPRNLAKVSERMDTWANRGLTLRDIILDLYGSLPEWGIPMIVEEARKLTPGKMKSSSSGILASAAAFISGATYKSPTKKKIASIHDKFDQYRRENGAYHVRWPEGQKTEDLFDIEKTVTQFAEGNRSREVLDKLLYTDYSILNDVIQTKLKTPLPEKDSFVVRGMPLVALCHAIRFTMAVYEAKGVLQFDTVCIRLTKAGMAGIPAEKDLKETDRNQDDLILEEWKKVTLFAGGVLDVLNGMEWTDPLGHRVTVTAAPCDFLSPANAGKLLKEGKLEAQKSRVQIHKIEFEVDLCRGKETKPLKFRWEIDPREGWMMAFRDLPSLPVEEGACLPIGQLEINEACSLRDWMSFGIWYDTKKVEFLRGSRSVLQEIRREMQSGNTGGAAVQGPEGEESYFRGLGEAFLRFRQAVENGGFFSALGEEGPLEKLLQNYTGLAARIMENEIYVSGLPHLAGIFSALFTIRNPADSVHDLVNAGQVLVPPWHPVTLEKLAAQVRFLRDGMRAAGGKKLGEQIQKLMDLAEIRSPVDCFVAEGQKILPCSAMFGWYAMYGEEVLKGKLTSAEMITQSEMVFEDDFKDRELRWESQESRMLLRVLQQYVEAYENGRRSLTVAFVDPADFQVLGATISRFAEWVVKEAGDGFEYLDLRLHVILSADRHGARTFLAYWANAEFSQDNAVNVKISHRRYQKRKDIPDLIPDTTDVTFWFDALNAGTQPNWTFQLCGAVGNMTDCPFPMQLQPYARLNMSSCRTQISQPQFLAATMLTGVQSVIRNTATTQNVSLVKMVTMAESEMAGRLQKKTVWLAFIDSALDKLAIRRLYRSNTGIIGFTTGEGSSGNLNMAITCREGVVEDLRRRCRRRLGSMFPSWEEKQYETAVTLCLEKARDLDGVSILRAVNPNDYEIHNYLAYLITRALCPAEEGEISILIRLDSYRHWFRGETKIPDFLLLQTRPESGTPLRFRATVIEAKIGQTDFVEHQYLDKAIEQVRAGLALLSRLFDPHSDSLERRYWYAQLYRAIVFLINELKLPLNTVGKLPEQLLALVEGGFEMEWGTRIMACELDNSSYLEKGTVPGTNIEVWRIGQLAVQNILLGRSPDSPEAVFDDAASVDENPKEDPPVQVKREKQAAEKQGTGTDSVSAPGEKSGFRQDGEDQVVPPPEVKPGPAPEPEPPVQPSPSKEGGLLPLKDVRVLIGKARRTGQDVFWEFGNPQLSNRHLLITGTSGQGKTYAIQTLLFELARQGISSVVFDYTDGFLPGKLETEFETMLGDNLVEYYAIANPLPVNPFRQQTISLPGTTFPEKPAATATRFAAIMKHVYSFGEQQRGALYSACRKGIERYGERMSFPILQEMLKQEGTSYAKTVLSKMQHLIDMNLFDSGKALNWSWLTRRDGKVTVFQLTSLDRDTQTILTEILLWDAWYSLEKTGDPDSPFVVVLDEAQNLSFTDGSPAQKILQEGRKYGWSAWFATQFMKGALSSDEISRLQQAPVSLHFRPSDEETGSVAQGLADRYTDASSWVHSLKSLQKGICVVKGDRLRPDGTFGSVPPAIVQVSNFGQRVREEAVSTAEPAAT